MPELTTSNALIAENCTGRVIEVYNLDGTRRKTVIGTSNHANVLTVRDLKWYETAWYWCKRQYRKVKRLWSK